jgi:hypothetical protein
MSTFEPRQALRRANPRSHPDFARLGHAVARTVQARVDADAHASDHRARTRRVRVSLAGASLAALAVAFASLAVASLGGGPGTEDAVAAVAKAARVSSASAERSGTAVLRVTHNGKLWASTTVRWHGNDVSVGAGEPSRRGTPGSALLVVDGVLYGVDEDGGWIDMGDPSSIDPESGTTPAEYLAAVREDAGGGTLRRLVRAMTGLTKHELADGTTLYQGSLAAGELARETGMKQGESLRVLPFGYVAHGDAEDPTAQLGASVLVGRDGLVRMISASWGEGDDPEAWTYVVAYSDLGSAAALVAPSNARSLRQLRNLHRPQR